MINNRRTSAGNTEEWDLTAPDTRSDSPADTPADANGPAFVDDDDSVPADIFGPVTPLGQGAPVTTFRRGVTAEDGDVIPTDIFQPGVAPAETETEQPVAIAESAPVEPQIQQTAPIEAAAIHEMPVEWIDPNPIAETPVESTSPSATVETSSSAGLSAWIEPLDHDLLLPLATPVMADATPKRTLTTTDWFKPFPIAPPLPPLPAVLTDSESSMSTSPTNPASLAPPRPIVKQYPDPEPSAAAAAPRPPALRADPVTMRSHHYETIDERPTGVSSNLDHLLRLAASLRASTLYLSSNARPSVRIDGFVQPLEGTPVLTPAEIESHLIALALEQHGATRNTFSIDRWSFEMPEVGRVRCVTFRDTRGPGAVFEIAPAERAGERVELSLDMQALATEREGIVIVAGTRASGKQAVLSAFVDLIDRARCGYLITVQREVTVHRGEGSLISQREAPGGLEDMLTVARAAQQENPDVLVLQDAHSAGLMNLAFDAAASGQLVIAGFSAPSAGAAIDRIINLFPPEQARQIQLSLAQYLRAVIGQVLVPKIGGGRVPARELLLVSEGVSSVLAAGKAAHLGTAIAAGHAHGSIPLSESLVDLVQSGVVSASDAYRQATDPAAFVGEMKRAGLDTSFTHRLD